MDKKEYIEREAFYKMIETKGKDMGMTVSNRLNCKDIARMTPNADVVPVVHGERKFDGLDFDGVDEILKKHRAFVMATIDGHGCHIGTYKKISLEADGDWIIEVDVESLSVTGQGDFAAVVHGKWIDNGIPESMLSGCSVCGFPCGAYSFNYCPMCGALMDEDKNDGN